MSWDPTPLLDGLRQQFAAGNGLGGGGVGELLVRRCSTPSSTATSPRLDRLSDRIGDLEDRVLEGDADRGSLREVLQVKRRLLDLRRILGPTRDVANQLLRRDLEVIEPATVPYYQDLYDHLVRVIDQLDVYRDLLAAVLDTRLTVASNSLNAVMKRLTALTVDPDGADPDRRHLRHELRLHAGAELAARLPDGAGAHDAGRHRCRCLLPPQGLVLTVGHAPCNSARP